MKWYAMRNGRTEGPVSETQIVMWAEDGEVDLHVRDEDGGAWMPILESPFGQYVYVTARDCRDYWAGIGLSILLPGIGFIVGLLSLLSSNPARKKLGVQMMAVSIVAFGVLFVAWLAVQSG